MKIKVLLHSYFRDLAGCAEAEIAVEPGAAVETLLASIFARFPKLAQMQKSMLVAVGVEYQSKDYILREGDEVSLFPPVQGG